MRKERDYKIDVDFHGETLYYSEPTRKTSMDWTWTNGYRIYTDSIQRWSNADGTSSIMTDDERAEVIRRVVEYASDVQGVKMIVE